MFGLPFVILTSTRFYVSSQVLYARNHMVVSWTGLFYSILNWNWWGLIWWKYLQVWIFNHQLQLLNLERNFPIIKMTNKDHNCFYCPFPFCPTPWLKSHFLRFYMYVPPPHNHCYSTLLPSPAINGIQYSLTPPSSVNTSSSPLPHQCDPTLHPPHSKLTHSQPLVTVTLPSPPPQQTAPFYTYSLPILSHYHSTLTSFPTNSTIPR